MRALLGTADNLLRVSLLPSIRGVVRGGGDAAKAVHDKLEVRARHALRISELVVHLECRVKHQGSAKPKQLEVGARHTVRISELVIDLPSVWGLGFSRFILF